MLTNGIKMQGKPLVWLDNASTTFKPLCVLEAVSKYYTHETSNSHRGDYDLCFNMDTKIMEARKTLASLLNAEPKEIVFTAGTTMSINQVAFGYAAKYLKEGDEILLTEAEHASNVLPWYKVCEMTGAVTRFIPLTMALEPKRLRISRTAFCILFSLSSASLIVRPSQRDMT